jgi:hypothetical protein
MNKLYIIFSLLIFSNCKEGAPQYLGNTTPLFDLKGFLDNEIATHLKDVKTVKKTVTVNGKTETKEVAIKDWKEELKPFFNSDINRPAWRDKYKVEEVKNIAKKSSPDNPLSSLRYGYIYNDIPYSSLKSYITKDKNLKTKEISEFTSYEYKDTTIEHKGILIENLENNSIFISKQNLLYNKHLYSIESIQTSFLGNKDTIIISVEY